MACFAQVDFTKLARKWKESDMNMKEGRGINLISLK
jgi:hypothetical protein